MSSESADQTFPSDASCPQFTGFSRERLKQLMNPVAAIRAATDEELGIGTKDDEYPDIFEFTHRPITVYETDTIGARTADDTKRVSEADVYDRLNHGEPRNYAILIQGTVGTGKSELCAYLTHRLRENGRPVLEIRKDDDLMTMLTERIPEFYERELGTEYPNRADYEQIRDALEDEERQGELANLIVVNALTELRNRNYSITCSDEEREKFISFIRNNFDVLREATEDEDRGSQIITPNHYSQKSCLQIFDDTSDIDSPANRLNTTLWEALLDRFDTRGLEDVFETVAEDFDRRPVAVFEDFSIASVQARELGEFIDRDEHGDAWDFVIAGTTEALGPLRIQTFLSRFDIFQTNIPGGNQVDYLSEENLIDFITPYLAYIKANDASIHKKESFKGDELPLVVQPPADGSTCGTCDICPVSGHYLFPFNETFIERIFNPGLPEDQRSPRELIKVIEQVIEVTYYGTTNVPSSAEVLEDLHKELTLLDTVYDRADTFVDLAKWYGEIDGDYAEVDMRFVKPFGVLENYEEADIERAGIEISDDVVKIPLAKANIDLGEEDGKTGEDEEEGEIEKGVEKEDDYEEIPLATRLYQEKFKNVDNWQSDPTTEEYHDSNQFFANAFEELINHLTTDYSIWAGSALRYNLSKSHRPFIYASIEATPNDDQIEIDLTEFRRSTLHRILKYGIDLEHGEIDRNDPLKDHGTQLTALADRWQRKINDKYVEGAPILYNQKYSGYDIDDFIVASYALCVMLDEPWSKLTGERLATRFSSGDEFSLDGTLKAGIEGRMSNNAIDDLSRLVDFAPRFENLLETRLSVSSTRLDLPEIRTRIGEHSPTEVISKLADSRIEEIDTKVRFTGTENQLRKLAQSARRTMNHLEQLEQNTSDSTLPRQVSGRLEGVEMEELSDLITGLERSYNTLMDPRFKEQLDQLNTFDQNDIIAVRNGASLAMDTELGKTARVQQTLALSKLQAHELVTLINKLYQTETTREGQFAPKFQEVATHYVSEDN